MSFPTPEPGLVVGYSLLWNDEAAALPPALKKHLGLDEDASWIVLDELNSFVWPGFDLRPVPGRPGEYAYGYLPPRCLDLVIDRMKRLRESRRLRSTPR